MAWFLWEEYGIRVSQSTVSRFLTRIKWSRKKARRVAKRQCQQLRNDYLANMAGILAHQMVFLDETIFNEVTGWRLMAWAPIGQDGRYSGDRMRGHTWSILAAYATTGYLPCYAVKEGYYNVEAFCSAAITLALKGDLLLGRSSRARTLPRRFRRRRRSRSFGRHKFDNIRIFGGEKSM
jgi:hypothetical protein